MTFSDGEFLFLQYLWGIETKEIIRSLFYTKLVFTVPMRNWNSVFPIKARYVRLVFTVPMRNWNKCRRSWKRVCGNRFYSTYEELKLRLPNKGALRKACFYSTYEELKQVSKVMKTGMWQSFLQYLWGIETPSSQ